MSYEMTAELIAKINAEPDKAADLIAEDKAKNTITDLDTALKVIESKNAENKTRRLESEELNKELLNIKTEMEKMKKLQSETSSKAEAEKTETLKASKKFEELYNNEVTKLNTMTSERDSIKAEYAKLDVARQQFEDWRMAELAKLPDSMQIVMQNSDLATIRAVQDELSKKSGGNSQGVGTQTPTNELTVLPDGLTMEGASELSTTNPAAFDKIMSNK